MQNQPREPQFWVFSLSFESWASVFFQTWEKLCTYSSCSCSAAAVAYGRRYTRTALVVSRGLAVTGCYWEAGGQIYLLAHSGSKCPELAKNKFNWCDFTSFFTQTLAGLSTTANCMRFIFKSLQIATATSVIRQFQGFLNLIFGGFLLFDPTVYCVLVWAVAGLGLDLFGWSHTGCLNSTCMKKTPIKITLVKNVHKNEIWTFIRYTHYHLTNTPAILGLLATL